MTSPESPDHKHGNLTYLLGELRRIAEAKEERQHQGFVHILQPHDLPIEHAAPLAAHIAS